jgi:hypothetical protein
MEALKKQLEAITLAGKEKIELLEDQAQQAAINTEEELRAAVHKAGYTWCGNCNGTGALERLDAGYMKRFGLQPWDGCTCCGGNKENRGRGFV